MDESDDTLRATPPSCRTANAGDQHRQGDEGDDADQDSDHDLDADDLLPTDKLTEDLPEDQWLMSLNRAASELEPSFENWRLSAHEDSLINAGMKKSLAHKLDDIKRTRVTSPIKSYSPFPVRVSTPKTSSAFDGRTFTRGQRDQFLRQSAAAAAAAIAGTAASSLETPGLDLTFDKELSPLGISALNSTFNVAEEQGVLNRTFDRIEEPKDRLNQTLDVSQPGGLNSTFTRRKPVNRTIEKVEQHEDRLNQTFDMNQSGGGGLNSTFTRRKSTNRNNGMIFPSDNSGSGVIDRRLSRGSSHDPMEEDGLSTTSDSSLSHQLNDVGDVQNIARIQEESLKLPENNCNNHNPNKFASVISPETSDHSPNTDYPSECSLASDLGAQNQNSYGQFSSQDSLPDSPYSSQSLDSQPLNGSDRIGRSMPNLNKRGLPPSSQPGQMPRRAPSANPAVARANAGANNTYGLTKHHNSDPRLLQRHDGSQQPASKNLPHHGYRGGRSTASAEPPKVNHSSVPSRGATASSTQARSSGLRPPLMGFSGSRLARPAGTGIPRPGASSLALASSSVTSTRLPMPSSTSTARSRLATPSSGRPAGKLSMTRGGSARDWRDGCY